MAQKVRVAVKGRHNRLREGPVYRSPEMRSGCTPTPQSTQSMSYSVGTTQLSLRSGRQSRRRGEEDHLWPHFISQSEQSTCESR